MYIVRIVSSTLKTTLYSHPNDRQSSFALGNSVSENISAFLKYITHSICGSAKPSLYNRTTIKNRPARSVRG